MYFFPSFQLQLTTTDKTTILQHNSNISQPFLFLKGDLPFPNALCGLFPRWMRKTQIKFQWRKCFHPARQVTTSSRSSKINSQLTCSSERCLFRVPVSERPLDLVFEESVGSSGKNVWFWFFFCVCLCMCECVSDVYHSSSLASELLMQQLLFKVNYGLSRRGDSTVWVLLPSLPQWVDAVFVFNLSASTSNNKDRPSLRLSPELSIRGGEVRAQHRRMLSSLKV